MSGPIKRLANLAAHLTSSQPDEQQQQQQQQQHSGPNFHTLSPTSFLPRAATIEPNAEAIIHTTAHNKLIRRTYRTFATRAANLAYFFHKHGLRRIGILCPNTPAFLETIFAAGAVPGGALSVGVNYRLKPDDIEYIFDHAEVDAIVVDAEFVDLLDGFRKKHPSVTIVVDEDVDGEGLSPLGKGQRAEKKTEKEVDFEAAMREGCEHDRHNGNRGWAGLQPQARDENDLIALAYTSGTTAKPKGVEFTHRGVYLAAIGNVIESGLNFHHHSGVGAGTEEHASSPGSPQSSSPVPNRCRYLWTLPLFHATGWTFPWSVTAVRGTHVCLRKIDYPQIWSLLKTEKVTNFSAAPTVNTLLCADAAAAKLPHPVRVTVAGSAPTAHLFETMEGLNLIPVHVYGMTESYGPLTKSYHLPEWDSGLSKDDKFARMARQGHGFVTSLPVMVIKPLSDDSSSSSSTGITVTPVAQDGSEIGEIVFRGNICAKGYHKDPAATAKLFAGGVLHTGDLALWHPDGAVQIVDREKDIIISGGENISSVALEGMLAKHPDVLEAGIVAVPDDRWGETPKGFVTLRSRPGDRTGTSPGEIIGWAKNNSAISKFMIPREIEVVTELPKTATGKIQKNVLRQWARAGTPADKLVATSAGPKA